MKSWSSIKFHTLLLGQNKNSLMFVRKCSGVAWIHFKGKFQKQNSNILLKNSWIPQAIFEGPLTQRSPFCQQNGYKTGEKNPASFRLFRGLSEFKTKLYPSIEAPQFFNDFLQIGIQWHGRMKNSERSWPENLLVTLHDLLIISP